MQHFKYIFYANLKMFLINEKVFLFIAIIVKHVNLIFRL